MPEVLGAEAAAVVGTEVNRGAVSALVTLESATALGVALVYCASHLSPVCLG